MLKKYLFSILTILICFLFLSPTSARAIEDPLKAPNNKIGIHILYDNELADAAELVNSSGGDWGYVLIPIQSGDRDLVKWQNFMDTARDKHLIPIIRLATEGDYFNTHVWREPQKTDIIDFANFLDSLEWPVKNRYIIVFNEVNRADEWGGAVNPKEYAEILNYAVSVFKSKSPDYFIISAGLDNAAPEKPPEYMNQYNYMRAMHEAVPNIFKQVDGLSSHSYPNPGFEQPPDTESPMGTGSFRHEQKLVESLSNKKLPVFITETGWTTNAVSLEQQAAYYKEAITTIWNDSSVVAITPFLLRANGAFEEFAFIATDGNRRPTYEMIKQLAKHQGLPARPLTQVLAAETEPSLELITIDFSKREKQEIRYSRSAMLITSFNWLIKN